MERLRTYCERRWLLLLVGLLPLVSLGMHLHLLDLPLQGVHAWRQCETASNVVLYAERLGVTQVRPGRGRMIGVVAR